MAVLKQWPYRRREIARPTPPFPYDGGKWGRWMCEEVPRGLPRAYDLIYDSPELDKLSKELGVDVRRRIENDFFRATIEYLLTFGKEPEGEHFFNMSPLYTGQIVDIGRIIGEPEYVHWGYRWLKAILHEQFYYDGMWHEAAVVPLRRGGAHAEVIDTLARLQRPARLRESGGRPSL